MPCRYDRAERCFTVVCVSAIALWIWSAISAQHFLHAPHPEKPYRMATKPSMSFLEKGCVGLALRSL